jgi:hypothetical protein
MQQRSTLPGLTTRAASGGPSRVVNAAGADLAETAGQTMAAEGHELAFVGDMHPARRTEILAQFEQILADEQIQLASRSGDDQQSERIYVVEAEPRQLSGTLARLRRLAEEPNSSFSLRQLTAGAPPARQAERNAPRGPRTVSLPRRPKKAHAQQLNTAAPYGADDTVDSSRSAALHTQRAIFVFRVAAPSSD